MKLRFGMFWIIFLSIVSQVIIAQKIWRPFSKESPWNIKISADAKTDSNSKKLIEEFSIGGLYINKEDWSIPVYFINSDLIEKVNVINSRPGIFGKEFAEPNQIPIEQDFIASPPVGENSDNHLCIIDSIKMVEWGMWAARKDKIGNWTTGLGAVTNLKGTGVEMPWFEQVNEFDAHRARAGGFPLIAGLIRPEEITAGKIEHALVFAYQRGRSEFFVPPASTAQATFMEMNNQFGIPMGGRVQLNPALNVDTLKLNRAGKIIAKALQEYGAYNGDYAGATVLYLDNSPKALKEWKGILDTEDLLKVFTPGFIQKNFRVIEMGNLLPGQNLKNGSIGFLEFSFTGVNKTKIDWLTRTVECVVDEQTNLSKVKPVFRTVKKNSVVTVIGIIQNSGKSIIRLTKSVVYKVSLGSNSQDWKIKTMVK